MICGRSMMRASIALAGVSVIATAPAIAAEPRTLAQPSALPAGYGAVRISVRSQLQLTGPLYMWFLREGGSPSNPQDTLVFERGQGVPFAGTNMIDSRPSVLRILPGRYRLVGHVQNCAGYPPPNAICQVNRNPVPTGHYEGPSVTFDVIERALTDAGEYVLELPKEADTGEPMSYKKAYKFVPNAAVRWRRIAAPLSTEWSAMKPAPAPEVADGFRSNLQCEIKPKGVKGMSLFYPFTC